MHSARWDDTHDLAGEKVAVVGTGASAIQIVPAIQPLVDSIAVYQRTPAWDLRPAPTIRVKPLKRPLDRVVPGLQKAERSFPHLFREFLVPGHGQRRRFLNRSRVARAHLHKQVRDPKLRAAELRTTRSTCKRTPTEQTRLLPRRRRPNAELITAGIAEVREDSIVDRDGVERPTDTIVLATGFHVTDLPIIAEKIRAAATAAASPRCGPTAW